MNDPTSVALSWEDDFDAWVATQGMVRRAFLRRSKVGVAAVVGLGALALVAPLWLVAAIAAGATVAAAGWVTPAWIRWSLGPHASLLPLGRWTWHLSAEAIRCHQRGVRWVVPWTSVVRIEATDRVWLFWLSAGQALHLPAGAVTRDVQRLIREWHAGRQAWDPEPLDEGAQWLFTFDRSVADDVGLTQGMRSPVRGFRRLWRIALGLFIGGLGLAQLWVDTRAGLEGAGLAPSAVLLGASALLLARFTPVSTWFWTAVVRFSTRGERGRATLGPTQIGVDVAGVEVSHRSGLSQLSWSRIVQVMSLDEGCLIRPGWGTPVWIPSRLFADAADQQRCTDQIAAWLRASRRADGPTGSSGADRDNPFAPPGD